jgi:hypothetical protein
MRARTAQVFEQDGVGDAGFLQRVREDSKPSQVEGAAREDTVLVGALRQADDNLLVPGELRSPDSGRGPEGITEEVT